MIRYHGGPIWPERAAIAAWTGAHALISFAYPAQLSVAAEVAHSFVLDNGAFTAWKHGQSIDVELYALWCRQWRRHPGFDWCLIPDVIEGADAENDELLAQWQLPKDCSVPVWHLHETLERLDRLVHTWPRVAIGSSGQWATPGTKDWWVRMTQVMEVACPSGYPVTKLHGLRQMSPTIFSRIPYSSVDSSSVARNLGIDAKWKGTYLPSSKNMRAMVLRQRFEDHASAHSWQGTVCAQDEALLG